MSPELGCSLDAKMSSVGCSCSMCSCCRHPGGAREERRKEESDDRMISPSCYSSCKRTAGQSGRHLSEDTSLLPSCDVVPGSTWSSLVRKWRILPSIHMLQRCDLSTPAIHQPNIVLVPTLPKVSRGGPAYRLLWINPVILPTNCESKHSSIRS